MLWTGVIALAGTLIPARAGAQPKIAQKLVQYQEKPKRPQECDNCLHFVAPSSCKMVDGKIMGSNMAECHPVTFRWPRSSSATSPATRRR